MTEPDTAATDADGFTEGRCTACEGEAERGPSGAWWHIDPYSCAHPHARFRPERWSLAGITTEPARSVRRD